MGVGIFCVFERIPVKFSIDIAGCNETGNFPEPMRIEVFVMKTRKAMREHAKKTYGYKMDKNVGATTHHLKDKGDGYIAEAFFNLADISHSVIIHESVHLAVACAHRHFGAHLLLSDLDLGGKIEETIAYLTDDIGSYIIGELQERGVKLEAWK
jgi:hypothetical protein